MWPCFWWGFLQIEPVAQIPLAGGKSEIFQEAAKVALEVGVREEEREELACVAEAESTRDARRRQRRRQAMCSRRRSAAA